MSGSRPPTSTAAQSIRRIQRIQRLPILLLGLVLLVFLCPVLAIQKDLAGIVEWHQPHVGEPLLDPTPPTLVPAPAPAPSGRGVNETWWVGITRRNILAVLDTQDGSIVWRQVLEDDDPVVSYHVQDDTILLLSGAGGTTARLFSLTTGHLIWDVPLLPDQPKMGRLTNPVHLGTDVAFVPAGLGDGGHGSFVVLSEGRRVTRIRREDGGVMWSTEAPGAGSTILFKQLLPSGSSLHILALHYSFDLQTLLTSTISLEVPIPKGDLGVVPSIVTVPEQAMIVSSHETGKAKVLWAEHGRIRATLVREDGSLGETKDHMPGKGRLYAEIIDVGLRGRGVVLGRREDGGVEVLDIASAVKVDEFENSQDSPERSRSVYSGVATKNGAIINRVYWSFSSEIGVVQTLHIPNLGSSETITSGYTFAFDTASHGVLLHTAIAPTLDAQLLNNLVLTTSSGAIQHLRVDGIKWTREESLADIKAVRFVDLGEPEVEEVREIITEEGYIHRLFRHVIELKDLPGYLFYFLQRLTTTSYTSTIKTHPLNSTHLHRDQFGFQKLLVAATAKGKIFALDSANGGIVWGTNLGLTDESGARIQVHSLWNVRDGEGGRAPVLAVVGVKTARDVSSTVAFHIDTYTGKVTGDIDLDTGLAEGTTLFPYEPKTVFPLPFENCGTKNRVLGLVDEKDKLHIFPACKKVAADILEIKDQLFFTTTSRTIDGTILKGHVPVAKEDTPGKGIRLDTEVIWSVPFTGHERVADVEPIFQGAIASLGRVLGDKSTLYKYLNPHLLLVSTLTLTQNQESAGAATGKIYVVDSTTGGTVYATQIEGVLHGPGGAGGIKVGMVENWLVYAWRTERGWRLGSVEMYENTSTTNGKGVTPAVSTFALGPLHELQVFEQTFVVPTDVRSLGFTTSKAGITTKELIIVNGKNQIVTLPRRILDPRRPLGKPSSRDKEEMLIPYDAMIPHDPKRVVSHKYDVVGSTQLASSPALVESTSLLLAYGLDLFLTRGITPSGSFDILSDSFNKAQLLLTLAALSVGIWVAGPAVRRKGLRMKWY